MDWNKELKGHLNRINFDGIAQFMKATDWYWHSSNGQPSKSQMISTINSLFWEAVRNYEFKGGPVAYCATGGFSVMIASWGGREPIVEIKFDISRCRETILGGMNRFLTSD